MAARRGAWSAGDLDTLQRLFGTIPLARLAARLRRTPAGVAARARRLFGRRRRRGPWSAAERERLRLMVGVASPEEIALALGRSRGDVQAALGALAGRRRRRGRWSGGELSLLKRIYGTRPDAAAALALGRPVRALRDQARRLCLGKDKALPGRRPAAMPRWTPEEVDRLAALYPHRPGLEVARRLGRSVRSVVAKAAALGLKKGAAARSRAGRENVLARHRRRRPRRA